MPPTPVDVLEHWRTVGEIAGVFLAAAIFGFYNVYQRFRASERVRADASPDIAFKAVGAAIVDKSTSDAIHDIAGTTRAILQIHERREKADQDEDLLDRAVERLRLEEKTKER